MWSFGAQKTILSMVIQKKPKVVESVMNGDLMTWAQNLVLSLTNFISLGRSINFS